MEVIEDTDKRFYIASQPSLLSHAAFFGFFAFGFTLSFYSESIFWQLLYILGSFIIASSFLGQWQKLIIDKTSNKLHYEIQNVYQKLFVANKHLVSENLSLEDMKQVKCNLSNGTISLCHGLATITIFVGTKDRCEMMLAKFKSLLPNSTTSRHVEQPVKCLNVSEKTATMADETTSTENESPGMYDDAQKGEAGDMPKTLSFDSLREDDDCQSSDDSFVKVDDGEFGDCTRAPSKIKFGEEEQPQDKRKMDDEEN